MAFSNLCICASRIHTCTQVFVKFFQSLGPLSYQAHFQGNENSKLMVLIAENVWSWVISTWQNFNKEQYCQSCQTILVPDVAQRTSCHIKHVPVERLLSLFFPFLLPSLFFEQIRAMLLVWRFCGGGYSLFLRNKDVIMRHVTVF